MKILQINNYHYLRGGSERIYFETSKILEKNGHEVICFSVRDEEINTHFCDKYFIEPLDYESINNLMDLGRVVDFIYNTNAKKNLESLIKNEKPDIAHLHIFYGRLTSSILSTLKKHKIPVVMSVHEYRMLCPAYLMRNNEGEICEKCANGNYFHCVTGKCVKNNLAYSSIAAFECFVRDRFFSYEEYIDQFIMVSQFIMDKHIQYKPSLKPKCQQIYNFIDLGKFSPNYVHENYYLYFGRLSSEKGILTLLNAWRSFPELRLKIIGGGELKNEIVSYIRKHQMFNVELLGVLSGDALFDVVKKSKYILVPSECYENNPMSIIESFALGKPVIGARIGGIPELVVEKVNGYLFESGNPHDLTSIISHVESVSHISYSLLGRNARLFAEDNFNVDEYYHKLIMLYNKLIIQRKV